MKFSIVTISFNQAAYLRETMESVLAQEGIELEYIVVDAGSTDGSERILSEYADRIDHLIVGSDDGPAHGLNRGFAAATGDVLGYLNSDDVYLPGALQQAAALLSAAPEVDVVYGDGLLIDQHGRRRSVLHSSPWNTRKVALSAFHVVQPATFVRRRSFDRVGGFNQQNPSCWDRELLVDLALSGARFHHARQLWAAFRLHPASITGSRKHLRINQQQHRRIISKALGRPPVYGDMLRRFVFRCERRLREPRVLLHDWSRLAGGPRTP
jgi:glycosyltransferase involved in cell wall biosynthesis